MQRQNSETFLHTKAKIVALVVPYDHENLTSPWVPVIIERKISMNNLPLLSLADIQGMRFNMVVHHEYFHLLVKFFH